MLCIYILTLLAVCCTSSLAEGKTLLKGIAWLAWVVSELPDIGIHDLVQQTYNQQMMEYIKERIEEEYPDMGKLEHPGFMYQNQY